MVSTPNRRTPNQQMKDRRLTLKMTQEMFDELQSISLELDLSKSAIMRRSFREFLGLHELEKEYPGSVIDHPKKVLGVLERF
jgi:hypothetical protein